MHDPASVGELQRFGDLAEQRQRRVQIERASTQPLLERRAVDQLHDQEAHPVGFLKIVDRGNPGVVERGERLGLAFEPRQARRVRGELPGQDLDRHVALELGVARAVDLAHPTRTDGLDHAVMQQRGARLHARIVSAVLPGQVRV